eukprot:TRINITY_DN1238_c0_g1_i2.p1 TRINITY_DN1238_c0_g1~~TRINITY_DN1238_c0_g1_i2.p1  ORF type:complete len:156 (+),score=50.36 TRINITY_DN1238_c0_g1_i2:353-820(+)
MALVNYITNISMKLVQLLAGGGAQWDDNIYEIDFPRSANACYQLTFEDPKNKAFWSFTVYDGKGFMFNDLANVSSNTAKYNEDGTVTVSVGCGADAINNIPSMEGNKTGKVSLLCVTTSLVTELKWLPRITICKRSPCTRVDTGRSSETAKAHRG